MEVVKNGETANVAANEVAVDAVTYPIDKFPRIQAINKSLESTKVLIDRLNKRKELLKLDTEKISEYEANEREITLIKTDFELQKVHTTRIQQENSIKEYVDKIVLPNIGEIDEKMAATEARFKKMADKDKTLFDFLKTVRFDLFEANWEHKFNYYATIKNKVHPNLPLDGKMRVS